MTTFSSLGAMTIPLGQFVAAFVLFEIKHLLADYILQSNWMASGKQERSDWLVPLCAHSLVHALGTFAIALAIEPRLWWIALADFLVHASIDRLKGKVVALGRLTREQPVYWWVFGADQQLHGLTNLALALILVTG